MPRAIFLKTADIVIHKLTEITAVICFVFPAVPLVASATQLLDDEYAVIGAAIAHGIAESDQEILLSEMTTGEIVNLFDAGQDTQAIADELGTSIRALAHWALVNRKRVRIVEDVTGGAKISLISEAEINSIFSREEPADNWQALRKKHPRTAGILRISRPGIDETTSTAVIYVEFECGPDCGSGRMINLNNDGAGHWTVSSGSLVWITAP